MITSFKKTLSSLCRLFYVTILWALAAINLLCVRISGFLIKKMPVQCYTDFNEKKTVQPGYSDEKQKDLIDSLNGLNEILVGYLREYIENTGPGRLAVKHSSDRHLYSVMVPNKEENIQRILNCFAMFPDAAKENAYHVFSGVIKKIESRGVDNS